eukprot:jgi/Mesvir1/2311/Mv25828-RA.1
MFFATSPTSVRCCPLAQALQTGRGPAGSRSISAHLNPVMPDLLCSRSELGTGLVVHIVASLPQHDVFWLTRAFGSRRTFESAVLRIFAFAPCAVFLDVWNHGMANVMTD